MNQSIHRVKAISLGKIRPGFSTEGRPYVTRQLELITDEMRLTFDIYGEMPEDIILLSYNEEFPRICVDKETGEKIHPEQENLVVST